MSRTKTPRLVLCRALVAGILGIALGGFAGTAHAAPSPDEVYKNSCAGCHGKEGEGKKKAPAVRGKGTLAKFPDDKSLLAYLKKEMPKDDPGSMSDDELKATIVWMRAKPAAKAPPAK